MREPAPDRSKDPDNRDAPGDLRWLRYLILDVDGTLTVRDRLAPPVLAALQRAADAGLEIILNTGRSAGWGAALLAYVPGVSAVVVENGGAWFARAGGEEECYVTLRCPAPVEVSRADRARLWALRERAEQALGLSLPPTADDPFRLTDHTAVRTVPPGPAGAQALARLRALVQEETAGLGDTLASSVHVHFMIDREAPAGAPRSKADGALRLLQHRGIRDAADALRRHAAVVGDSGNDASLFAPGRFALTVGVANIAPYLPELAARGAAPPQHITRAAEGLGVVELIDDLLAGRFGGPPGPDSAMLHTAPPGSP